MAEDAGPAPVCLSGADAAGIGDSGLGTGGEVPAAPGTGDWGLGTGEEGELSDPSDGSDASDGGGPCECVNWCSSDVGMVMLTGHHERCTRRGDDSRTLRKLVVDLVRGMEKWADEEDGVYGEAWDAYRRGKAMMLEFVARTAGEAS